MMKTFQPKNIRCEYTSIELQVVPKCWEGETLWPGKQRKSSITKAIAQGSTPLPDWDWYKVQILKEYGTYSDEFLLALIST